jgi:eukaryotic-like serine/threonine-protein kinase
VEAPAKGKESQRLRAASALAMYEPDSQKWAKAQEAVSNDLVRVPALHLSLWTEWLRPVGKKLLPQLSVVFRNVKGRETERSLATDILADYAADQPKILADLLMDADERQFAVIYPKLKDRGEEGLPVLTAEINTKLAPDLPSSDEKREKLAKRQANAGVALLRMNQQEKTWPLLKRDSQPDDPRMRTYLIHRLRPLQADPNMIINRLDVEQDVTVRRALLLALGEFDEKDLPPQTRKTCVPKLKTWYSTDSDPGIHAATEWLLRQWQQQGWLRQVIDEWAKGKVAGGVWRVRGKDQAGPSPPARHASPGWYVNNQGLTMIVIPGPVEFIMGSPASEEGRNASVESQQHKKRIGRTFALAAMPVTLEQYRKFNPGYGIGEIEQWARTPDSPVIGTDWFQAAAYCNWLSKREGLAKSELCYEPLNSMPALAGSSVGLLAGSAGPLAASSGLFLDRTDLEYTGGMKLAPNYLHRTGYRLPTEAEMEYAIRAGASTSRYFGETEELLDRYVWYQTNSHDRTWPVGSKKPNDLGFFDILGNVSAWCQEAFARYPQNEESEISEDNEGPLMVVATSPRVLRGGSFILLASSVRSANRNWHVPTDRVNDVGLRPARTFTP